MNTEEKEVSIGGYFTTAIPGSIAHRIYQNNMDDSSFNSITKSIKKTLALPKQAFFDDIHYVYTLDDYACKVKRNCITILYISYQNLLISQLELVFRAHHRFHDVSFGVRKGFPYTRFLREKMIDFMSTGIINKLHLKHEVKKPYCTEENMDLNIEQISLKKVVSLFVVIISGMLTAILLLFGENIKSKMKHDKIKPKTDINDQRLNNHFLEMEQQKEDGTNALKNKSVQIDY